MAYNSTILRNLLRARSLSRAQLAERIGIPQADLERELDRRPEPRQGLLNDIAKELALPPFIFFMEEAPSLQDVIPDFRSETPAPSPKSKSTIEAIHLATGIQRTAEEGRAPGAPDLPQFSARLPRNVDAFAERARAFFEISLQDQLEAKDARAFYLVCRKKIEDKGIFVLQDSFPAKDGSGFCLSHPDYPVIVINTQKQTRGRRLFTLIHELGHVLLNQSGISDPFVRENATERLCNRFASSFLVPATFVDPLLSNLRPTLDPDVGDVAWVARRLKISQEATVLRLEELGLFRAGSHQKWKVIIHNFGNPDFSERGGGAGGPPPQSKVKLARYGFRFASTFDSLLRQGKISEINLYRASGLKPKYQSEYFEYAESLSLAELRTLELDDE